MTRADWFPTEESGGIVVGFVGVPCGVTVTPVMVLPVVVPGRIRMNRIESIVAVADRNGTRVVSSVRPREEVAPVRKRVHSSENALLAENPMTHCTLLSGPVLAPTSSRKLFPPSRAV